MISQLGIHRFNLICLLSLFPNIIIVIINLYYIIKNNNLIPVYITILYVISSLIFMAKVFYLLKYYHTYSISLKLANCNKNKIVMIFNVISLILILISWILFDQSRLIITIILRSILYGVCCVDILVDIYLILMSISPGNIIIENDSSLISQEQMISSVPITRDNSLVSPMSVITNQLFDGTTYQDIDKIKFFDENINPRVVPILSPM